MMEALMVFKFIFISFNSSKLSNFLLSYSRGKLQFLYYTTLIEVRVDRKNEIFFTSNKVPYFGTVCLRLFLTVSWFDVKKQLFFFCNN